MENKGTVFSIISNLLTVKFVNPVLQREICYVIEEKSKTRLMSEVIKVTGDLAYVQVYESTRGLKIGDEVIFTGHLLEAILAPGLLSKNIDGLGNDLEAMTPLFLQRGDYVSPINMDAEYEFTPTAKVGDIVSAGSWLGFVKENWIDHQIMVPFIVEGEWKIKSIVNKGKYKVKNTVAVIENSKGETVNVTMFQYWPIKEAIKSYVKKPRPFKLLKTGVRVFDTMNPMMEGGTGFIPGPFGCGKTVLQHAISQHAEADLIIMAACGERANEVVELFTEFPELDDPRTGRKLKERTIIICNTSNMPVASREASVYIAMTISEYYRQMGLKVLLLADSTSRWAQALREISNRMEELPGPDAFPMDLPFIISNFYSRAGYVELSNGKTGSVTFIGTVSPAGGNLKEPVTEGTKKIARCFYALSQDRADTKRYPAVDTVDSYSKYLEYPEVISYLDKNVEPNWVDKVMKCRYLLIRGKEAKDQINILGDDSVPLEYHDLFWKAEIVDFVILQQDAFDDVDSASPMERQKAMLNMVLDINDSSFEFTNYEDAQTFYKNMINIFKQMNYSKFESDEFKSYQAKLETLKAEKLKNKN